MDVFHQKTGKDIPRASVNIFAISVCPRSEHDAVGEIFVKLKWCGWLPRVYPILSSMLDELLLAFWKFIFCLPKEKKVNTLRYRLMTHERREWIFVFLFTSLTFSFSSLHFGSSFSSFFSNSHYLLCGRERIYSIRAYLIAECLHVSYEINGDMSLHSSLEDLRLTVEAHWR